MEVAASPSWYQDLLFESELIRQENRRRSLEERELVRSWAPASDATSDSPELGSNRLAPRDILWACVLWVLGKAEALLLFLLGRRRLMMSSTTTSPRGTCASDGGGPRTERALEANPIAFFAVLNALDGEVLALVTEMPGLPSQGLVA